MGDTSNTDFFTPFCLIVSVGTLVAMAIHMLVVQ